MNTAASSARSRSASSKTTNGDLPPSSMLNFFRPASLTMRLPVAVEPVNEIARTSGCAHQRLAGLLAVAVHDVQHAGGNARFQRQFAQPRGGQRRQLAHLQHRGVAEREAGRDLPGGRHERHVPRRDQRAHADRMEQRVVQVRVGRVGVAVDAHAHLGEVRRSCRPRAAPVACRSARSPGRCRWSRSARDLGHVRRDQVAELANQLRALRRGHAGPLRERRLRGRDGGIHFRFAADWRPRPALPAWRGSRSRNSRGRRPPCR